MVYEGTGCAVCVCKWFQSVLKHDSDFSLRDDFLHNPFLNKPRFVRVCSTSL